TMLPITTTGAGVPGNPFWTGNANDNRSKVWAYGLRNSFRFSLRPGNTVPFLGDVGWNTWEKISAVPARANLGWPCYEGFVRQAGYEPNAVCQTLYGQGAGAVNFPLTAWTHNNGSSAAMGGIFYTGTTYPAAYQGSYFYGNYGQSWFHTMQIDANNQMVANSDQVFGTGADNQVSMD